MWFGCFFGYFADLLLLKVSERIKFDTRHSGQKRSTEDFWITSTYVSRMISKTFDSAEKIVGKSKDNRKQSLIKKFKGTLYSGLHTYIYSKGVPLLPLWTMDMLWELFQNIPNNCPIWSEGPNKLWDIWGISFWTISMLVDFIICLIHEVTYTLISIFVTDGEMAWLSSSLLKIICYQILYQRKSD